MRVSELTELQERAVEAGVLDGYKNLLVIAPTSFGKTLVGEFCGRGVQMGCRVRAAVSEQTTKGPHVRAI